MAARDASLRRVLAAAGLDPALAMTRARGDANEVWLGDELVVRINDRDPGRLAREAQIIARVAPEARVPAIVSAGAGWMVMRRAPGIDLGRAWGAMSDGERERAIGQLAEALAALHATPLAGIPDGVEPPHTLPLAPLLALADQAIAAGGDRALYEDAAAFVRERWDAFDLSERVLAHGDPHLENVLWDGRDVSALLDLEWARAGWRECDLEILLAIADHPALFAAADYEAAIDPATYDPIALWLCRARPDWFAAPRLLDRLEVLHVSRTLGFLADAPAAPVRVAHLRAVLAGTSFIRDRTR